MCGWIHCHGIYHYRILDSGGGWAIELTAVSTAVLAVGALFALFQIREAKRTRHTEAAARMLSRWDTTEYVATRIEIDKFESDMDLRDAVILGMRNRTPERYILLRELGFLEELGAMEKLGATSLRWIEETMKDLVLVRWKLWEPTINGLAEEFPDEPDIYQNFRSLADRLNGKNLKWTKRLARWMSKQISY